MAEQEDAGTHAQADFVGMVALAMIGVAVIAALVVLLAALPG